MEDFSLHHLIGFMGGLQVNSLVFTSQNEKRLAILPVFFRFLFFVCQIKLDKSSFVT